MNDLTPPASLLRTKQHFEILDGLRGIAAIAVVIFHFMEIVIPDYSNCFIAHAFLAVDFFFCLSGFVIAYAYDTRLPAIGISSFFKLRLIRLHPLVLIGSVIGLVAFLLDPYNDLWTKYSDRMGLLFLSSCFMIPYPIVMERFGNLFHLNPPTWSLFWEYIANIVYAFVLVRIGKKGLWGVIIIGAVLLFYESHRSSNIVVGWNGETFGGGAIRVLYSFPAGILIYRMGGIIRSKLGFITVSVLLVAAFLVPFDKRYNRIVEPSLVVIYFPFVIALGAGATLRPHVTKLCRVLGELSYPLYMVHYPFIWLFLSYVLKYKPSLMQMTLITVIGTILLIGLAWIILTYVDEPIRKFFKSRLMTRQRRIENTH